jgi:predicted nucleic acid-binding protein
LTISIVLADANILYSRTLRDYVLYAADEGAIEIHWSQDILDEMSRNLQENLGLSRDDTTRLEELMNDYIEYALIDVDRADLATVEHVEMDAADRHILAAAISADADIILTENTKHFPGVWMSDHGIELMDAPASSSSASPCGFLTRCEGPTTRPFATHEARSRATRDDGTHRRHGRRQRSSLAPPNAITPASCRRRR